MVAESVDNTYLAGHLVLHKLVELVYTNVLERSVLSLTHKPHKDFFECVLFALLISEIECVAALLIKCSKSVG